MKKIYALAAVAFMAMAANAQNGAPLYITGASFEPEWSAMEPKEFTWDAASSTYVYEGENLTSFCISTVKGTAEDTAWDEFNAARMQANTIDKNGEWVNLEAGTGNILAPYPTVAPKKGKVEVKGDLSQIKVTMESEKTSFDVYLRGDMNGWLNDADDATKAMWKLTAENENTYYINFAEGQAIAPGESFKIADGDWAYVNFGDGADMELDVPYALNYNGQGNCTLAAECTGSVVLVLGENLMDPAEVTFSNDEYIPESGVNGIAVEENGVATYFNLQGVRVNDAQNGLYIVVKNGKAQKVLVK